MSVRNIVENAEHVVSSVFGETVLIDETYDPENGFRLAVWDGANATYHSEFTFDGTCYAPMELEQFRRPELIYFPEEAAESGSTDGLHASLTEFYRKYFLADPSVTSFMAHYAMMSWLTDRFRSVPYLRFLGHWGTGKTRALELMHLTCYRSLNFGVGATPSVMFRSIELLSPTLILDEADWAKTNESAFVTQILNAGYRKSGAVWRSVEVSEEGTKDFEPRAFPVYGCKVIATRRRFADEALESRCVTFELSGMVLPDTIPVQLPPDAFAEAARLRNRLLRWRFEHWASVVPGVIPEGAPTEGRFRETFSALFAIFGDEILPFAKAQCDEFRSYLGTGQASEVIAAIVALSPASKRMYMKDIATHAGMIAADVGPLVRELGFRTQRDNKGVYLVADVGLLGKLTAAHGMSHPDSRM